MKTDTYLIFDIGKTNKKMVLYDTDLNIIQEESTSFEELLDGDGDPCDDLAGISEWILQKTAAFLHHPVFQVKGINFSAYGASMVHLDQKQQVCTSFYNYLKPVENFIWEDFLHENPNLLLQTASPALRMLNSGFQLYWLKYKKPEVFRKIHLSLHFPQYLSFLFGKKGWEDPCSLGSHTLLWNFETQTYAEWITRHDLKRLFPPFPKAMAHPISYLGKSFLLGNGLHDSSAALIPYRQLLKNPFVLISTGTWSISLNPFDHQPVDQAALDNDCLCYLQPDGQPVKGARIFLGKEFEVQVKLLVKQFGQPLKEITEMTFPDRVLFDFYQTNIKNPAVFSPLAMSGTGPKIPPSSTQNPLSLFESLEEAYLHLMLDLVRWQKISTDWCLKQVDCETIVVSGGFVKNRVFLAFLQFHYPKKYIFTSEQSKASTLGAVMAINEDNIMNDKILYLKQIKIKDIPS
ncbi:FGGY family carbohydrate kinase [Pararhodonellum marinum]|uniref:FGGY family carbohydrate kinase n=1 Tax=Pararhodonellum marinum TaxID=2755358 RepID=UPI00188F6932|nr:FGGY family carbohydrate kinase [Pararhodonellum marinum]